MHASGSGSARKDCDRLVRHHLGQAVRTQQQAIARMHVQRVSFDVDARFVAAHHVRDHGTETVPGDLLGLKLAPAKASRPRRTSNPRNRRAARVRHSVRCAIGYRRSTRPSLK